MTPKSHLANAAIGAAAFAALFLIVSAMPAMAQDLSPVSNMLTTVKNALTGPVGKAIATIAVIAVGYACFLGRLNWTLFALVLIGAVLVFSADAIVAGFV